MWGKQMPAERSLEIGGLPLGLAHGVRLNRDVGEGEQVRWSDVDIDVSDDAVRLRRQMEEAFAPELGKAAVG